MPSAYRAASRRAMPFRERPGSRVEAPASEVCAYLLCRGCAARLLCGGKIAPDRPARIQPGVEGISMQYRRISADCHLDMIWLPPDLFTSEAPQALKDQMPYVKEMPDGTKRWVDNNGADYGMAGGVGASGTPYMPGKQLRVDKMHAAGLYDDFKNKGLRRPGDPHLRVKEL